MRNLYHDDQAAAKKNGRSTSTAGVTRLVIKRSTIGFVAIAAAAVLLASSAFAVTDTADLTISATVIDTCLMHTPTQAASRNAPTDQVQVHCSNGTTYSVVMDNGVNPAAAAVVNAGTAGTLATDNTKAPSFGNFLDYTVVY